MVLSIVFFLFLAVWLALLFCAFEHLPYPVCCLATLTVWLCCCWRFYLLVHLKLYCPLITIKTHLTFFFVQFHFKKLIYIISRLSFICSQHWLKKETKRPEKKKEVNGEICDPFFNVDQNKIKGSGTCIICIVRGLTPASETRTMYNMHQHLKVFFVSPSHFDQMTPQESFSRALT